MSDDQKLKQDRNTLRGALARSRRRIEEMELEQETLLIRNGEMLLLLEQCRQFICKRVSRNDPLLIEIRKILGIK